MMHRDVPVYVITNLKSPSRDTEHRLLWQGIGLLAQRAGRTVGNGFCRAVRDLLVTHESYMYLDRVCLVRIIGDSNVIEAVDVETSISTSTTPMIPGYRCVVDPAGSLMQLTDGQVRIFREASDVVATFARRQMPCQRSIRLIESMGMRSGMCLPLYSGGRRLGFLFLNSCEPGLFDRIDERQANLLALAIHAASSELSALGSESLGGRAHAEPFHLTRATELLRDRLITIHGLPETTGIDAFGDEGFFQVTEHFLLVSCAAIAAITAQGSRPVFALRSTTDETQARITITANCFGTAPFQSLHRQTALRLAQSAGYDLQFESDRFSLASPCDRARTGISYSV